MYCTYYVQIQAYAGAISKWAGQWYSPANVHVNCNCVCFYLYVCMIMIFLCQCTCKVQLHVCFYRCVYNYIYEGDNLQICASCACYCLVCLSQTNGNVLSCFLPFSQVFQVHSGLLRFLLLLPAFFFFASIVAVDKCEAPRPQMLVYSCLEGRK